MWAPINIRHLVIEKENSSLHKKNCDLILILYQSIF